MKNQHFDRCQVSTPPDIVALLWKLALQSRKDTSFKAVLDLGAGDARFASSASARYDRYDGIELDHHKFAQIALPEHAKVTYGDALRWTRTVYDLCIGNPPYIRHHHLDAGWRREALDHLAAQSGVRLKSTANIYILFLLQSLLRTRHDGLVVQLVPFEWVTRPSASELRTYIQDQGWDVQVYRFDRDIFPRVLTTASVVIIDKARKSQRWRFGTIDRDGSIQTTARPSGSARDVLPYTPRCENVYAMRGLSPGGQKLFVLSEQERLYHSLKKGRDVSPCVTSLRRVDELATNLDRNTFERYYIRSGAKCWLIRTDRAKRSPELIGYLETLGTRWKKYATCTKRKDWAAYKCDPAPALLVSSGFVGKSPKIIVNDIGAIAVGSVYGIHTLMQFKSPENVVARLRAYDFRARIVHHSNNLKKLEVRQLNTVLHRLLG